MKLRIVILLAALAIPAAVHAQSAKVVTTCGAMAPAGSYTAGQLAWLTVDANGNMCGGSGSGSGSSTIPVGASALATGQVSCPTTTATQTVAARTGAAGTGRVSVTLTNTTGTQAACFGNTGVTTSTGECLPAVAGASLTLNTTAAIFCQAATAAQTISFVENF